MDAPERTARRMARAWRDQPALQALRARIAALPGADRGALLDAAAPLMSELGWLRDGIAAAVRAAAADPWFEPPWRTVDPERRRGFVLWEDRHLRLAVHAVPLAGIAAHKALAAGVRSITFPGTASLMRVVRAGGCELDLWHAPRAGGEFAGAEAGRATRAGRIALRDGQLLRFDGTREAWTIARQTGDLVTLQATARDAAAPLAVEYDVATGAYLSASATDTAVARLQLMATLLRLMARRDAAPALATLAADGPFFQRWHMARELTALDRPAALPVLAAMAAGDRHREVRHAAARTLKILRR